MRHFQPFTIQYNILSSSKMFCVNVNSFIKINNWYLRTCSEQTINRNRKMNTDRGDPFTSVSQVDIVDKCDPSATSSVYCPPWQPTHCRPRSKVYSSLVKTSAHFWGSKFAWLFGKGQFVWSTLLRKLESICLVKYLRRYIDNVV